MRSGAPIYAAEEVIAESAIEFEHDVEESEDVVEKFKEFLDQVTPEDFAAGDLERTDRRVCSLAGESAGRIRPTSRSSQISAASAASGSRLVSVSPGTTFVSSTDSSPVSSSSIRSTRATPWHPEQPVCLQRQLLRSLG